MASLNKVELIGNCGRDCELRFTAGGQAVANVSIATSSRWRDKTTGNMLEDVQWHRVTFYDQLAEVAGEYATKGRQVYVEGRLKYGKYTDKDGVERNTMDIVASRLLLLGTKPEQADGAEGQQQENREAARQRPAPANAADSGFKDMDDDIPF